MMDVEENKTPPIIQYKTAHFLNRDGQNFVVVDNVDKDQHVD